MAIKKSPRKKKKATSRRNIILLVIAIALGSFVVWASMNAVRQQQLEREDREKFAQIETDMGDLKSRLDNSANVGGWNLEKSCEKPGTKLYSGEAGYCRIDVEPQDRNASTTYKAIKMVIDEVGHIDSEGYSEVVKKNYIGFTFSSSGNVCGGYFTRSDDMVLMDVSFSCGRTALHMYYAER